MFDTGGYQAIYEQHIKTIKQNNKRPIKNGKRTTKVQKD